MLFGSVEGIVLDKSQYGYADGTDTFLAKIERPMARFLLDAPTETGETTLTLDLTTAQYDGLTAGAWGKISWWGERLSDFVPSEHTAEPWTEAAESAAPPAEVAAEVDAEAAPPSAAALAPEDVPAGEIEPIPPAQSPPPEEEPATVTPLLACAQNDTICPWCGKPMGVWRMSARDNLVMKRGEPWQFDRDKLIQDMKALATPQGREKMLRDLKGFLFREEEEKQSAALPDCIDFDSNLIFLSVCETCEKAVINYH